MQEFVDVDSPSALHGMREEDGGMETMDDIQATAYLQNAARRGSQYGLQRIRALLCHLGNPQDTIRWVHIAGTNGKGSVLAYLAHILIRAGYRVGSFTSPAVFSRQETIQVNGVPIPREAFAVQMTNIARAAAQMDTPPTAFEMETALAMCYFQAQKCDIALLETGMGGAEDATNVVTSTLLEIFTPISRDHTAFLGDTLQAIATQKAGILKPGTVAVSASQPSEVEQVLRQACAEKQCALTIVDPHAVAHVQNMGAFQCFSYKAWHAVRIQMAGDYQICNAALALEAVEALRGKGIVVPDAAVYRGMEAAVWHGRFTILQHMPLVILDGAHNAAAADALRQALVSYCPGKRLFFVMGMFRDKDYGAVAARTVPLAAYVVTVTPPCPERALPAETLAKTVSAYGVPVETANSVSAAVTRCLCLAQPSDGIVVFGSLSILQAAEQAVCQYNGSLPGSEERYA